MENLAYHFAATAGHAAGGFAGGLGKSVLGKRAVTGDLKSASTKQCEKILANSFRQGEMVERKRLPSVNYRLHSAKWLSMDKMLKHLLFPLQSLKCNFGFTSYSGVNKQDVTDLLAIDKSPIGKQRTQGHYRGVAFFDIRNTSYDDTITSNNTLNSKSLQVGGVNGNLVSKNFNVDSSYRIYQNGPSLVHKDASDAVVQPFDGNFVDQHAMQTFQKGPLTTSHATQGDKARSISMGINLSQIEAASVNSMCYADPIFTQGRLITAGAVGSAGAAASVQNQNNTELVPGQTGVNPSGNKLNVLPGTYNSQVRNGIVRIADGKVVMDIVNTENTCCVVEIVIHAKKKNNMTKQEIFNRIFGDAQTYYNSKGSGAPDPTETDYNSSGGWQTFYDPDVPLLKLPSNSPCYSLVSEVHRSNHILAPGQSKLVTIHLGSHWYKLINKNDVTSLQNTQSGFTSLTDNAGSLYCSVGHSGFLNPQGIQAFTDGTDNTNLFTKPGGFGNPVNGSGWWVGATHTPSSIMVSGGYDEKFYPLTIDRSTVDHTAHHIHHPAYIESGTTPFERGAVPTVQIIPEKVVVSDSTFRDTTHREEL
jgi:hypothetical protein